MCKLAIIIPVFDGWNLLTKCLQSLVASVYSDFEVIVVDHGPPELDRPALNDFHENLKIHIVKAEPELWWTGATNAGIKKALEESPEGYIMLLNHDCYVQPDTLSFLMDCAHTTDHSVVAPIQIDAATKQISVITAFTSYLFGFPTLIPPAILVRHGNQPIIRTGMIVGGRGVIVPKGLFQEVGLLDEDLLPHYGSDNDFYLRCKSAGYNLYICKQAIVEIDKSQTTGASSVERLSFAQFVSTLRSRKSHRNVKDQISLFKKHYPVPGLYPIGVIFNLVRYTFIYLVLRGRFLISRAIR